MVNNPIYWACKKRKKTESDEKKKKKSMSGGISHSENALYSI